MKKDFITNYIRIFLYKHKKIHFNLNAFRAFSKASLKHIFIKKRCHESIQIYKDNNNQTFFGYYDKSPLNESGNYVLFHSTDLSTQKKPSPLRPIFLNVYNIKTKIIEKKIKIYSYNWQQGCRPQWLSDTKFIFNNFNSSQNKYISSVYDIEFDTLLDYPFTIYDASSKFALTLNYQRLAVLRPDYGYFNIMSELPSLREDGIYYCNYEKNETNLLLSIDRIVREFPIPLSHSNDKTKHKVNHIMISPNKKHFIFLHRYFPNNLNDKYDRLFLYDFEKKKIDLLCDEKIISHYSWNNDNCIIVFMRYNNKLGYYFIFLTDKGLIIKDIKIPGINSYGDGHPTIKNNYILTDSYPDKNLFQHLLLYSLKNNNKSFDIEFYHSPFFQSESRCDLHPKWNFSGNMIFFDSIFSGKRQLYSITL